MKKGNKAETPLHLQVVDNYDLEGIKPFSREEEMQRQEREIEAQEREEGKDGSGP